MSFEPLVSQMLSEWEHHADYSLLNSLPVNFRTAHVNSTQVTYLLQHACWNLLSTAISTVLVKRFLQIKALQKSIHTWILAFVHAHLHTYKYIHRFSFVPDQKYLSPKYYTMNNIIDSIYQRTKFIRIQCNNSSNVKIQKQHRVAWWSSRHHVGTLGKSTSLVVACSASAC